MGRVMVRRLVRLHIEDAQPGVSLPSFEGVLVGYKSGHYVLANARLVTSATEQTALDGRVYVPRDRVLFMQEVAG